MSWDVQLKMWIALLVIYIWASYDYIISGINIIIICEKLYVFIFSVSLFTVWRPNSDIEEQLKEGKRFKIYNLMVGEVR